MRLSILLTSALSCFIPALFAGAQDVSIDGMKLGMTLQEAQAKLPPGLHISTPKTDLPSRFTILFAQRAPLASDDIDNEGFTVEAVDGKVAYIKRIVIYSPDRALDREVFKQSLTTAYGPASPYPIDVKPAIFPVWVWDQNGKLVTKTDSCPIDLVLAGGAAGFYRPVMATAAPGRPGKEDRADCNVVLSVLFDRRTDKIPHTKLDWIEYTLSDYSKFLSGMDQGAAADKPMQ